MIFPASAPKTIAQQEIHHEPIYLSRRFLIDGAECRPLTKQPHLRYEALA
jgi:hypothetical protein